jgi:hypothetical protein
VLIKTLISKGDVYRDIKVDRDHYVVCDNDRGTDDDRTDESRFGGDKSYRSPCS